MKTIWKMNGVSIEAKRNEKEKKNPLEIDRIQNRWFHSMQQTIYQCWKRYDCQYICVVCFKYCIFNILGGHENTAVSKRTYCLVISLGEAVTNHNAFIDETAIVLIGIRKFYQSYWSSIRPFFRLVQIGL